MPVRSAEAVWEGDLQSGRGTMRFGGGAFEGQYSFSSRFEEGAGTNPEELIAAAHAGCYSMFLSGSLTRAGHPPRRVQTTARVRIERVNGGFSITRSELTCEAEVPDVDEETFRKEADGAKANCPVSKVLQGAEITLDAKLTS